MNQREISAYARLFFPDVQQAFDRGSRFHDVNLFYTGIEQRSRFNRKPVQDWRELRYTFDMVFITAIILAIGGWLVGTGINYLADVLPLEGRPGLAACARCGSEIGWVRYILLQPCLACRAKRSIRSYVVQLFSFVLAIVIWFYPNPRLPFGLLYLLIAYFGLVTLIDLEHRVIVRSLSLVGLLLGFAEGWRLHGTLSTLEGGAAGLAIMLILYWLGRLFSRAMAKRHGQPVDEEALGFGDVHIATIIGLVLGWPGIVAGLLVGILIGGLISGLFLLGMLVLRRYRPMTALPYAPFLLAAALILLLRP